MLSDVSQTLLSTFSLAATGTGGLVGSASSGATNSSLGSVASSTPSSGPASLLEEDMEVFSAPLASKATGSTASADNDDGEWNW